MLLAGVGGFVGTCCRFLIGKVCSSAFHGPFPFGTFLVNLIGCFLIGLLFGLLEKSNSLSSSEGVLLTTGFCGGFTTFSTFANEIRVLGEKGDWSLSILYLLASVILGILLVWVGRSLTSH